MKRIAWTDLLLIPFLAVIGLLIYGLLEGMAQSLGYIPSLDLNRWTFAYYIEVLQEPHFIKSLLFSLQLALLSSTLALGLGLLVMYFMLKRPSEADRVFNMSYIPIIVPHMIVALFTLLVLGQKGFFARVFFAGGFEGASSLFRGFVHDQRGLGIILAYLWKEVPFVIFYSYRTLKKHQSMYGEIAEVLGASSLQSFMKVTVPLSKETLLSAFIIMFTYTFASYDLPHLLGPTLPQAMPEAAYTAFIHPSLDHRPYAMVYNGIMLGVCLLALIVFLWSRRKQNER